MRRLGPDQRIHKEGVVHVQELTLRGSPFDQSVVIGDTFSERIRARASACGRLTPESEYLSEAERASECPDSDDSILYLAQCAELLFYIREHAPDLIELMHGVARGAGCTFEEIFRLNCQRAIAATRPREDIFTSCSAVAARTDDAGIVLARTGDYEIDPAKPKPLLPGTWDNDAVVFEVVPDSGMRHVLFGSAETLVAGDGMNEAGVSFGCLNLPYGPPRTGGGIPYNLVGRALVQRAESVEHAAQILSGWRQASRAKCWPVVDAAGGCLAIEKCFDRTGLVRAAPDGVFAQANDYLSPELRDLADHNESSADRVRTLREFISRAQARGGVTVATMEAAVRLHAEAGSLCRHGDAGRSDTLGFTTSAVLYLPEQSKMRVLYGDHPCRTHFQELTFDF